MNNKEIHDLVKLIDNSQIAEFKLEQGDFSITIRSKDFFKGKGTTQFVTSVPSPSPAIPAPSVSPVEASPVAKTEKTEKVSEEKNSKYIEFKSPMVGTFYRKPSPDKEVFVKVGDKVNKGDVVCIIEAMKLFNEIECEISGTVVKVLADDQTPVEFDQALFLIDPA